MIPKYITFPKTRIVKLLTGLSVFSGLILLSEPVLSQVEVASSSPPSSGGCSIGKTGSAEEQLIENCYQDVQWKLIPNQPTGYVNYDAYIGVNTIVRNGDSINFDTYLSEGGPGYARLFANCRTHVYAVVRGGDTPVNPDNYSSANRLVESAIDMACSLAND